MVFALLQWFCVVVVVGYVLGRSVRYAVLLRGDMRLRVLGVMMRSGDVTTTQAAFEELKRERITSLQIQRLELFASELVAARPVEAVGIIQATAELRARRLLEQLYRSTGAPDDDDTTPPIESMSAEIELRAEHAMRVDRAQADAVVQELEHELGRGAFNGRARA